LRSSDSCVSLGSADVVASLGFSIGSSMMDLPFAVDAGLHWDFGHLPAQTEGRDVIFN
jgi:hypothetical protein